MAKRGGGFRPGRGYGYICDGDYEYIARQIALENGLPATEAEGLIVQLGYYDAGNKYEEDFPVYKDFINENHALFPDEINNAVMVSLDADVDTFLAGILGSDKARVSARAVAYGKRYTFLATGDTGIDLDCCWMQGFNVYRNCIIGSNGPVSFQEENYETFEGTWVEAMGEVTGADGKVDVIELTKELEAPEIDWDGLREQAEDNGVVYTQAELEGWPEEWATDGFGNQFRRLEYDEFGHNYINYCFIPAGRDNNDPGNHTYQGDHQGRTYFFEVPEHLPTGVEAYVLRVFNNDRDNNLPEDRTCWNFTLAAQCSFASYPLPMHGPYYCETTLGNVPEYGDDGIVYIYSTECDGSHRMWYTRYASMKITEPNGVIFHTEGRFVMYTQKSDGVFPFRLYADSIQIYAPSYQSSSIIFEGAFGPLDSNTIRLGKLEPAGG